MDDATPILSTDRCFLRPAAVSDYDALLSGIGAPEFPSELPLANLQRQGKLKIWLDSILAMSSNGRARIFSVDLRTGERCIGQVSLVQRDQSESWNLAFWLNPAHWGVGLAGEAAAATVEYAFTIMAIQEVWAGAAAWNQRSINALLKLGLHPVEATQAPDGNSCSSDAPRTFSISRDCWLRTSRGDST